MLPPPVEVGAVEFRDSGVFYVFVSKLLKALDRGVMRADIASKYSSEVTSRPVKGTYLREPCTTSTKVVGGTPEK